MREEAEINDYVEKATKLMFYRGCTFWLSPSVMEPKYESFFFVENIKVNNNQRILDLGTGTGFLAILLAPSAKEVVATDVNPKAASCARTNVFLNNMNDKITVLEGDLFEPVKGNKFDLIVTNPPQMPTPECKKRNWDSQSLADDGGPDGRIIVDHILRDVNDYLEYGGRFFMIHMGTIELKKTIDMLEEAGLKTRIEAEIKCPLGKLTFERKEYIEKMGLKFELEGTTVPYQRLSVVSAVKLRRD